MLLRDEEHGHLRGIEQRPSVSAEHAEHPKWIVPHESHVEKTDDGRPIVPTHENEWDRKGNLMILVVDADDEARMSAEKKDEPESDPA